MSSNKIRYDLTIMLQCDIILFLELNINMWSTMYIGLVKIAHKHKIRYMKFFKYPAVKTVTI